MWYIHSPVIIRCDTPHFFASQFRRISGYQHLASLHNQEIRRIKESHNCDRLVSLSPSPFCQSTNEPRKILARSSFDRLSFRDCVEWTCLVGDLHSQIFLNRMRRKQQASVNQINAQGMGVTTMCEDRFTPIFQSTLSLSLLILLLRRSTQRGVSGCSAG